MNLRSLLCAALLMALCLYGVVRPAAAQAQVRVWLGPNAVTNLDPVSLAKEDYAARDLAENLFVGLVRYSRGTFEPLLAKRWEVSADGLTWTFQLRTDIQWMRLNATTGKPEAVRPVTPGDFLYGIRRACDQAAPNPAGPAIFVIAGCATINNANPVQVNDIFITRNLKIETAGADKLTITFAYPTSATLALLALPEFRPIAREAASKNPTGWATSAGTLYTNGPFVLAAWNGNEFTLARNPNWPLPYEGNITAITALVGPAPDRLDAARGNAPVASFAAPPGDVPEYFVKSISALGFSLERPGVSNDNLRRAFAFAIDRTSLAPGTLPSGSTFYNPAGVADPLGFDANAARAALAGSNIPGCTRLPEKFDLAYPPELEAVAGTLLAAWNKTLGCNVTSFNLRKLDANKLLNIAHGSVNVDENQAGAPRPHLWLTTFAPDYLDPQAWIADALHCQYGFLRTNYPCGPADAALDQAAAEQDPAKREALFAQAQAALFGANGTFPVVPLFYTLVPVMHTTALDPALGTERGRGVAPFRFDLWKLR